MLKKTNKEPCIPSINSQGDAGTLLSCLHDEYAAGEQLCGEPVLRHHIFSAFPIFVRNAGVCPSEEQRLTNLRHKQKKKVFLVLRNIFAWPIGSAECTNDARLVVGATFSMQGEMKAH